MDHSMFPETHGCVCGREAKLMFKDITTQFKGSLITVTNVPVYECVVEHVKMARLTRVKIRNLLKEAYNNSANKIDYK